VSTVVGKPAEPKPLLFSEGFPDRAGPESPNSKSMVCVWMWTQPLTPLLPLVLGPNMLVLVFCRW
jgi:hypothetical protein